jgi:hypothetical protein
MLMFYLLVEAADSRLTAKNMADGSGSKALVNRACLIPMVFYHKTATRIEETADGLACQFFGPMCMTLAGYLNGLEPN